MKRFFFYLCFVRDVGKSEKGEKITNTIALGYFSTKKKALDRVECYKKIEGFCDYPISCFKVIRQGVEISKKQIDKSTTDLYELSYEYTDEKGYDIPTIFGVYENHSKAQGMLEVQKKKTPFNKYPENFDISLRKVDRDFEWREGFKLD